MWFPLILAALIVVLAVYIVIWAVIVCFWAVDLAFAACALGGIAAGAVCIIKGDAPLGLLFISAGLVLAGLAVFMFLADKAVTKGAAVLTKKIALGIKSMFLRKGNEK